MASIQKMARRLLKNCLQRTHPEDRAKWQGAIDRAIAEKSDYEVEFRILLPDGTVKYIHTVGHPVLNASGDLVQFVGSSTDITERKRAEQATRLLAAIVESSHDAIVSKSLNGVITSWNKGAERLFGYAAEEAVGQNITLIIPPERRDEERTIIEQLTRGERVDHFETVRMRKDGSLLDVSLTISPMKDASGRVVGASKLARDITERKRAEEALRQAQADLAHVNRVTTMGELTASLAHEVNQPIAAASHRRQYLLALADARSPRCWKRRARLRRESSKTQSVQRKLSTGSACSSRRALRNGSWLT